MIIHLPIKINDLIKSGKDYLWPRPAACPCCGGKLWGHGYTARYFSGCKKLLWLKRYRCIDCHAVHTLRPKTHWRRFQTALATIVESIQSKIVGNRWLQDIPRQRQQYWFQGFKTQLGINNPSAVGSTFKHLRNLLTSKIIAATHSFKWFKMMLQGPLMVVPAV